jgi:hypothetical protein
MKPPLRPHFQQRRMTLVEYFGLTRLLFAFAMRDFFAIGLLKKLLSLFEWETHLFQQLSDRFIFASVRDD